MSPAPRHPTISRRTMIQAGAVGILGLGMGELERLRAEGGAKKDGGSSGARAKSVIYVFLSGGLAQHESFDMKPDAPSKLRGEFKPISTKTPGVQICEHLPMLAKRSEDWALVRSLTHPYNEHSQGHMVMLSGRTPMPPGFDAGKPKKTDWPAIASIANYATKSRGNLPPAVVLPQTLVHRSGRVIPGQFGGEMGARWDPWLIDAAAKCNGSYGACPDCFHHEKGEFKHTAQPVFQAPDLSLPQGISRKRMGRRLDLLDFLGKQQRGLERHGSVERLDSYRQKAISLLADAKVRSAFDVTKADKKTLERYGANQFGWSLLMARRLVETGVNLIQVNLGNNETWDTHQAAFPNLKQWLLPPFDRAMSAFLDDLKESGLLDDTLVVVGSEFGRTPRIFKINGAKLAGRDHWGAVQSVMFAGGGVRGGTVIGSSDKIGAYPATDPQTPEGMAATIYEALGLPKTAVWKDELGRPHHIYHGEPIEALIG